MKAALVISGPDVTYGPLALLSGPFPQRVQTAAALGYQGVELMVRDPATLDWEWLKQVFDSAGVEVPQIVTGELFAADGLSLLHRDPQLRQLSIERARAVIDLAAHLGAMVNLGRFLGQLKYLGPVSDPQGVALEQLQPALRHASDKGVRLTLEPLNRYETDYILTAGDAMRLIEGSGCDNLGVMLDSFHMNIEESSFEDGFHKAGDRLWHVHLADSNRRYPGSGHIDFRSILGTLMAMDFQKYVSAELLPLPDADTAASETIKFIKSTLSEIRPWRGRA